MPNSLLWKTLSLTALAMICFAANSILCRWALKENSIDPASFTMVRLASGAIILMLIVRLRTKSAKIRSKGSWLSASMLFLYAFAFSLAYVSLDTGTGALILFGAVQLTMVLQAMYKGKRLNLTEWTGLVLAIGGFAYLLLPGATAPSLKGFLLMSLSGVAWGIYTLNGKSSEDPLQDTGYNFLRSIPFLLIPLIWMAGTGLLTSRGLQLAIASGAITSGIGYTIWYMALRGLGTVQASVVQLSVPLLAAFGGLLLLSENPSLRLGLSGLFILGGIFLVMIAAKASNSSN